MNLSRATLGITTAFAELSETKLRSLVQLIGKGEIRSGTPASEVEDSLGVHGPQLQAVIALLRSWDGPPAGLIAAIDAGLSIRRSASEGRDVTSLIWTAPVGLRTSSRSTFAVTNELMKGARQNITVIGYRIHRGAKPIFETLAARSNSGVKVRLVLDSAEEQLRILSQLWPGGEPIDLYSTPDGTTLHAKLTIVDGRDMLVTSANLTGHGLRSNIEVGVRVQGPSAYSAYRLINKLIENRYFVRVHV